MKLFGWCCTIFFSQVCQAQKTNDQLWLEFMLQNPFANVYNLETAVTYSSLINVSPKWNALDIQPTLERALTQHVDIMGALLFSNTYQNDSLLTRELRPMLGVRFHFTPNSRILTRMLVRFENRNFLNTETDSWQSSNRTRVRAEAIVPFNKPTMFAGDKLWYGIFDAETFIVLDKVVEERFANRYRIRAAIGYRLNYACRFELMYTLQGSRNEIGQTFETIDHIYRIRFKYFLNPSSTYKLKVFGSGN